MSERFEGTGWVRVEQVWKKFQLGERHDSLRDLIPSLLGRAFGGRASAPPLGRDDFWAVREVDFEVRPGQALGIIGGNGAGKSTLLKLITKILRPTHGRCQVRGRVGALIEIAAGFHPDLTGRENVFLQGAIMGMRGAQIRRQFDQIVEFSGVERFIDTPVKRFSSGMNARLGFAIAAHLDPDVLIIDEVLSVGDFKFQTKAFDRIRTLVQRQIPVIVVSHQLDRISSLCTDAILLDRGQVAMQGTPMDCINAYIQGGSSNNVTDMSDSPIVLTSVSSSARVVASGERVTFTVRGRVTPHDPSAAPASIGIRIRSLQTSHVLFDNGNLDHRLVLPTAGAFELIEELDLNVAPGLYSAETHVKGDPLKGADIFRGPSLTIQVEGGPLFWGLVQMNSTMRLSEPPLDRS